MKTVGDPAEHALRSDVVLWEGLEVVLMGRAAEPDHRADEQEDRHHHLEYFLNHDGIGFFLEVPRPHICERHPAARAVVQAGFLPASFSCPLARGSACPMHQLREAAGGGPVRLRVVDGPLV